MARWQDVVDAEPEFAKQVQAAFDAHRHKTIATVRKDGGPRISGIEANFADGELWFGSMTESRKGNDLRRDPRFALHSNSEDPGDQPQSWRGDAKLAGRAILVRDPERLESMGGDGEADLFRADLDEVVLTHLDDSGEYLVIELWRPGRGLTKTRRK
jgi:general stress protein 26